MTLFEFIGAVATVLGAVAAVIGIGKWLNKKINPEPEVRYVHIKYPEESGLIENFNNKGLKLFWCNERKLQTKLENEGAEHIIFPPNEKKPVIFKVKSGSSDLVLIYKKKYNDN